MSFWRVVFSTFLMFYCFLIHCCYIWGFSEEFFLAGTFCIFFINIYKCGHRNVLSKSQVWMSIFHIINFKKKKIMDTGSWIFFNKKLILDYYFCLKSGPVFLFQIFIIAPLPLPRVWNCIINNKLINNKFRFSI